MTIIFARLWSVFREDSFRNAASVNISVHYTISIAIDCRLYVEGYPLQYILIVIFMFRDILSKSLLTVVILPYHEKRTTSNTKWNLCKLAYNKVWFEIDLIVYYIHLYLPCCLLNNLPCFKSLIHSTETYFK